jgi:glyoxylate reductase
LVTLFNDRVDAALIDRCQRLRAISNYAVGLDNIDLDAASRRRIPVGHTPGVLTDATADLAFTLLLAAARRLPDALDAVRRGDWRPFDPTYLLGRELHGTTLGIVGFGRIGRAMAKRAEGFDMRVIHSSTSGGLSLEGVLRQADFVSLHVPLTPATHHLMDAGAFAHMRPSAILINTARGAIVDHVALRQALVDGAIGGAALDVTEPEPLPLDDPLLDAPNLIVTPHYGSGTYTARHRMTELAVENLLAALAGQPMPHQANDLDPATS